MLQMRVGLTRVRIRRPRSIDGEAFSRVVDGWAETSRERRKTTDSVRDMEREFLRGLNVGVMRVILAERKIARGRLALYSLLELGVRELDHASTC